MLAASASYHVALAVAVIFAAGLAIGFIAGACMPRDTSSRSIRLREYRKRETMRARHATAHLRKRLRPV